MSVEEHIRKLPTRTLNPPPDFNEWIEKKKVLAVLAEQRKHLQDFLLPSNMGEWIRKNSDSPTIGDLLTRFIQEYLGVVEEATHPP